MRLEVRNELLDLLGWIDWPRESVFWGSSVRAYRVEKMIGGFGSEWFFVQVPGTTGANACQVLLDGLNFVRNPNPIRVPSR